MQVKPFKCHISQKPAENIPHANIPHARTWLRTIGTIKFPAQVRNDTAIFTIHSAQYVSGTGAAVQLAEFDLNIRHNTSRKNLQERTKKAKVGSKVSIIGELDIYDNKIYVELHNFDFLSFNTTSPPTTTNRHLPTPTPLSEKRSLMYKSLFDNPQTTSPPLQQKRKVKKEPDNSTPPIFENSTSTNNQHIDSVSTINDDRDSLKSIKRQKLTKPKMQLRSNQSTKISNLASKKLDLPPQ